MALVVIPSTRPATWSDHLLTASGGKTSECLSWTAGGAVGLLDLESSRFWGSREAIGRLDSFSSGNTKLDQLARGAQRLARMGQGHGAHSSDETRLDSWSALKSDP